MRDDTHRFDAEYYESYKSITGLREKGDKPPLYAYWKRYLRRVKPEGKLLDIGCGLGVFMRRLEDVYEVYGIDVSHHAVEQARKLATKAKMGVGTATHLPFEANSFDITAAFDVVEHLEDPELLFREARRVLKQDGLLVLSTPNPHSLGARIKEKDSNPENLPYSHPLRKRVWHGWRDTTHIHISPIAEWRRLLASNGFAIVRDGTDFIWDVPYFKRIPFSIQWASLVGLTWILVWINGFYPWKFGEEYVCVARKM
jgi:SAM-dependent methyltransferase